MAWDRVVELCLVICRDTRAAQAYMDRQPRGVIYAWAPRWSCVIGHNPATTTFICVEPWWMDEQCEKAFWWLKDRGFRERYPP